MRKFLLSVAIVLAIGANAQFNESFADGDFASSPAWTGTTSSWQIVTSSEVAAGATGSNTLRLNASGGGTNYLSTQILGSWNNSQNWTFWVGRRLQAATTSNRIYVWLYATESDVTNSTVDGYRILYGDNSGEDNIFLERITNGIATTIFTSPNTTAGTTLNGIINFGFLVRVTRDASGLWTIYTSMLPQADATGAIATEDPTPANTSVLQGSVTDNSYSGFTNGYVALHTLNTSSADASTGVEFDQLRVLFFSETILPVKFSSFDVRTINSSVSLKWNVATEENVNGYEVEKSPDGRSYLKIGFVRASGKSSYSFVDVRPSSVTYYRIKSVDVDGRYGYSTVALIKAGKSMIVLKAFPSPFITNLSIQHGTATAGSLITISSADGRIIKSIVPPPGAQQTEVDLSAAKPGMYLIHYSNVSSEVETLKILKPQ